ncbi:MAG: hypothetical protein QW279_04835 [Candidatus Jordarchaeaceae archaeon]
MSVHLHTTISRKTNEILEQLAKTYGTKSSVIEKALQTMLRVEKVGSCEDCIVKAQIEEQSKLREALDLSSLRKTSLDGLLSVAIGDQTFSEFLKKQKNEARNTVELLKSSIKWKTPTNFKEFLIIIEQIKDLTRLYDIASYNELDNTAILRPRIFTDMPQLVAYQLSIILEGLEIPFSLRMMGEDVALKMMRNELYALKKIDYKEQLFQQMEEKILLMKPSWFKNNLVLVGPAFMKWVEKNLEGSIVDLEAVIEDIRTFIKPEELPEEPNLFMEALFSAGVKMNWLKNVKFSKEGNEFVRVSFQASPYMANIVAITFSLILATKGWKLISYSTEYDNGNMTIQFVGEGDKGVLDQLVEVNLYRVVSEQFLDTILVPRDIFDSFAAKVFESDRTKFEDIYQNMGTRIANAIRMLAKNDIEKTQRLARDFIVKNLNQAQPSTEIRFIDDEHFTIIFKKMDPVVINSQRILITSMLKSLGYEVSITAFQNLLNFKIKRVEKPILETIPRDAVMQTIVDAMSSNSLEEAFNQVQGTLDNLFPIDYLWTIREVGSRIFDMYREMGIAVEIEYFEGGFTLKYKTCPYYKLVRKGDKKWLCDFRKKSIEYIIERVTHGKKGKIKIIKSLLKNEHPCEYAIFLKEFLE